MGSLYGSLQIFRFNLVIFGASVHSYKNMCGHLWAIRANSIVRQLGLLAEWTQLKTML